MIYFDNAASTKPDSSVLDLFNDISSSYYANPSSIHKFGVNTNELISKAKIQMLKTMNLEDSHDVIFLGSATEANNLAIQGYLKKRKNIKGNIITSLTEHPSVLEVFYALEKEGYEVRYLSPNKNGLIDLETLKAKVDENTILVSLMGANNEIGTINEIEKIGEYLKNFPKCVFHSDASQSIGKVNLDYRNCDLLTITSHKIYGLKGVAALFIKKNLSLECVTYGGGQQNNYRSGTMDAPNIVAFSRALRLNKTFDKEVVKEIFKIIYKYLDENKDLYAINFANSNNPFVINFSTLTKKASVVTEALSNKDIMVSSVSACSSKKEPISHVVMACTNDKNRSMNTIRLSFGKYNTVEEANIFIKELDEIIRGIK